MVLAVLGEAAVHVGEAGADAVLVALQRVEADGVGEVRGEELVGLCFQPGPVRGQIGQFLIVPGVALVERGIDVGGEALVGAVVDGDARVGVGDEPFGDGDGHGPSRAGGFLGGSAGADEVGVGDAARVGGEVEQHPRPAGAAVKESLQVVGVLDVAGHPRRPRPQQRLHPVEEGRFHDGVVRAGMQGTFVADHARVVRVGE
nr:hypothetical protein [Propionibacterium freudenreichii]